LSGSAGSQYALQTPSPPSSKTTHVCVSPHVAFPISSEQLEPEGTLRALAMHENCHPPAQLQPFGQQVWPLEHCHGLSLQPAAACGEELQATTIASAMAAAAPIAERSSLNCTA
jgi:hypothetical protein